MLKFDTFLKVPCGKGKVEKGLQMFVPKGWGSVTRKISPNVYKSCPKMISL